MGRIKMSITRVHTHTRAIWNQIFCRLIVLMNDLVIIRFNRISCCCPLNAQATGEEKLLVWMNTYTDTHTHTHTTTNLNAARAFSALFFCVLFLGMVPASIHEATPHSIHFAGELSGVLCVGIFVWACIHTRWGHHPTTLMGENFLAKIFFQSCLTLQLVFRFRVVRMYNSQHVQIQHIQQKRSSSSSREKL